VNLNPDTYDSLVELGRRFQKQAIEGLLGLAQVAVRAAQIDPLNWSKELQERDRFWTSQKCCTLLRIGQGRQDPRLWDKAGRQYQLIRWLPLETHRALLDGQTIEVFSPKDPSNPRMMSVADMEPLQAEMVFMPNGQGIRNLTQQRNWLEMHLLKNAAPSKDTNVIPGKGAHCSARFYSVAELKQILKRANGA